MFESLLYRDPQAQKPACFCPRCGAECYWPGLICIRCEKPARTHRLPRVTEEAQQRVTCNKIYLL